MPKRSSKPPHDPKQLAAHLVAQSTTGQEPKNLAERAQHTVTTEESLSVQTARISDDADKRQEARENLTATAPRRLDKLRMDKHVHRGAPSVASANAYPNL